MEQQDRRGGRPSFSSFWKKGKGKLRGREIKFVQQGARDQQNPPTIITPEPSGRNPDEQQQQQQQQQQQRQQRQQSATDKAKIRRAQVRRAQIQHRQRKAEYVKQLELDVSHFRELISLVELESEGLRSENETMRVKLLAIGAMIPSLIPIAQPQSPPQLPSSPLAVESLLDPTATTLGVQAPNPIPLQPASSLEPSPQDDPETPEMFADINIDDLTVTLKDDPQLGTPVFSVSSGSGRSSYATSLVSDGERHLSPAQEYMAINFILALEHICWNHFFIGDFPCHEEHSDTAMGHTLMASTFCMADAPQSVFMGRKLGAGPKDCRPTESRVGPPVDFQWSTTGLSLDALHNLALSLNPGDLELTPVQAWFELARGYPPETLLRPRVLEALSAELNGVVKCLHFGAVMEREAFESVAQRLLGPPSSSDWVKRTGE